mgnify:CR=1 FL=1
MYSKQHYIPQCFMKAWSNNDNVNYYNISKSKYENRNISSIFYKKHLYSYSRKNIYNMPPQEKNAFYDVLKDYIIKNELNEIVDFDCAIFNGLSSFNVYKNGKKLAKSEKNNIDHLLDTIKSPTLEKEFWEMENSWEKILSDLINFHQCFYRTTSYKKAYRAFDKYITKNAVDIAKFVYYCILRNPFSMEKPLTSINNLFYSSNSDNFIKQIQNDGVFKQILNSKENFCNKFFEDKGLIFYVTLNGNFPCFQNILTKIKDSKILSNGSYIALTPNILLKIVTCKEKKFIQLVDITKSSELITKELIKNNNTNYIIKEII